MQRSGLNFKEPSFISLAPNWQRSAQIPHGVHFDKSVTEAVSDTKIWGASPNRCVAASMLQQQEQQQQIELTS
jgi:hypothetical protein